MCKTRGPGAWSPGERASREAKRSRSRFARAHGAADATPKGLVHLRIGGGASETGAAETATRRTSGSGWASATATAVSSDSGSASIADVGGSESLRAEALGPARHRRLGGVERRSAASSQRDSTLRLPRRLAPDVVGDGALGAWCAGKQLEKEAEPGATRWAALAVREGIAEAASAEPSSPPTQRKATSDSPVRTRCRTDVGIPAGETSIYLTS